MALICCTISFAAPLPSTPAETASAIHRQGAHAFLASLSDDRLEALLDRIGSGDAAWIALAPKLAPGADAWSAEGLGIALARALPKNPAAVLKAAEPAGDDAHILALSRVCGIPFIDAVPPGYKVRAIGAVQAVTDPALHERKQRCLATLRAS